jgi:D-alanine-D-alanine ligase
LKVAVVYNRESRNVINLFGVPNREKYGKKAIARITDALKKGGHQVIALEGDKDLVPKLEEFMPRVVKGELPGMVFNLSYGIQGQARYTHVPSILEMMGLPYVGSGPLAHSLALDKVVAKVLFRQNDVPTPAFVMLKDPGFEMPPLDFPLIVKPKNESTSFGIKVVHDEAELRDASQVIFDEFGQAVLVEQYIDGREINVGLIGNRPPEALPPAELDFGDGPKIYTLDDKRHKSGRDVGVVCPARLTSEQTARAQQVARDAFEALGCADCARVDLRLSHDDEFYVLEINSLPSLGEHGSYTHAAAAIGLDFAKLINRLVEVASARYFGTPQPPILEGRRRDRPTTAFAFLTRNRDRLERRLQEWVAVSSRTEDPIGQDAAFQKLDRVMDELGMEPSGASPRSRAVKLWQTETGYRDGTLIIGHIDVPMALETAAPGFRREPEWLYGEGIGSSRGPLTILEFALKAAKSARVLNRLRLGVLWYGDEVGVLWYGDEGRDCRYSGEHIRDIVREAKRVIVLRPVYGEGRIVTGRRGTRTYRLTATGDSIRIGARAKGPGVMLDAFDRLAKLERLTDRRARIAVAVSDIEVRSFPLRLPHTATATLQVSYPTTAALEKLESRIHEVVPTSGRRWHLAQVADRPPMPQRKTNIALAEDLHRVASEWDIKVTPDTSALPSPAGLVPPEVQVVCGLGPSAQDLNTPQERISRISLVQRTLLLAQFLISDSGKAES